MMFKLGVKLLDYYSGKTKRIKRNLLKAGKMLIINGDEQNRALQNLNLTKYVIEFNNV